GVGGIARPMHPVSKPGAESRADDRAHRSGGKRSDHRARHKSDGLLRCRRFRFRFVRQGHRAHAQQPDRDHRPGKYSVHNSSSHPFTRRRRPSPRESYYRPPFRRLSAGIGANSGKVRMNSDGRRWWYPETGWIHIWRTRKPPVFAPCVSTPSSGATSDERLEVDAEGANGPWAGGSVRGAVRLGFEGEGREIGVAVVVVLVLGAFQEGDNAVSHGRGDDFPAALEGVLGEHDGDEVRLRHAAVEGDEVKK